MRPFPQPDSYHEVGAGRHRQICERLRGPNGARERSPKRLTSSKPAAEISHGSSSGKMLLRTRGTIHASGLSGVEMYQVPRLTWVAGSYSLVVSTRSGPNVAVVTSMTGKR